ncbi:MAG: glutamyl-tRNA amidotransferase [Candidatus Taylorbacteria bacterium CG10_big_fil_rev_8_21_14_0_10_41_48]|uniref:Glutamyl-tRNA amidotransferase n=1 Tax=Candidatus Taylorbacteria bacterium CG10_big_fil_rev_8_21_14_0_10_41_48 TaxID=1975024 RepID=A0A2M8LCK0_9BACT|nr:MAG: glutamyl-tRNA amidotransferase [Candidatus Taylorbacteria bacterium CG10_big_fil_rev_8_21_14_0_10_41_48]
MLTEKVKKDMQDALRAKDALRLSVLRGALSEFTNALVAAKKKPTDELSDEDALAVFKRLAKQRKESAEQFTKGNRPELAEKEMKELEIIEEYLPEKASKEQIEEVAKIKIAELGAVDKSKMGQLMGAIMKELGGNADGTVVKEVVEELLP